MENKHYARILITWVSLSVTVYQLCYCMPSTNSHITQDYYTNDLRFSSEVPHYRNMIIRDNKDARDNKDTRDRRDIADNSDTLDGRDIQDNRDTRDGRDIQDNRNTRDGRDIREYSLSSKDLSPDDSLGDYLNEDAESMRDWLKKGSLEVKKSIVTKRKGHEVARMFMLSSTECIIINSKGEVTGSRKSTTCDTYGKFCHKVSGSSLQLYNIQTGKYLAVNRTGLIYSTSDSKSKDTVLTDVIADHNNFSIYVYKIIKAKKCYVTVNSNNVLQSCSLLPKALKPRLLGTCS